MQFSGLYKVTNVSSVFSQGMFKQTLTGMRRPMQESTKPEVKDTFSVSKTVPDPTLNDSVQRFDDGSSIQTFDDGSTIVTDSDGNITSTEATG